MVGIVALIFTIKSLVLTVQESATELRIDPNYLCKIAKIESDWKPSAVNKKTSAKGLFQLTKPTESALRKRYKVSGDIYSPRTNSKLAALLTKEHSKYLKRKKLPTTHGNLYALHFFGITTGYRFLTTSDETKVKLRFPKAYRYNKVMIGNKTVGELKQYINKKLNRAKNCNELI